MKRYLGVDLHKNRFTVCILKGGERVILEYSLHQLEVFKKTLMKSDEIALEATSNSAYFYRAVAGQVAAVHLVDPGQFQVIAKSAKKTDRRDAVLLALFLSKGLLPEVRLSQIQQGRLKSLVGTRDYLVKTRTGLKNKIHNILTAQGIPSKKRALNSKKGLQAVLSYPVDDLTGLELGIMVEEILHLCLQIDKIEKELEKPDNQLPGHTNLTSIKGIGDLGSTVLLSVIGNIEDFPDADHLASYLGLVPRVRQSNDREIHGHITKKGNRLARSVLVQCTWSAISSNPILRAFYYRLKAKKGSGKALIATARKFLIVIYYTLSNNIIWEDFPQGIIASRG
jgi:transposase